MKIHIILEPDVTPEQIAELGLLAESYGISAIWIQNYSMGRDPFMSLVPLARASKRIQLGVVVVSPYEMHPLKMSNALLTLNELAAGRASMVIGGGGEWVGIMGVDYGRRIRAVQEAVEIVKKAASGEGVKGFVNYDGEIYKSRYYRSTWADVSGGAPIVYAGATKKGMLKMAVRYADGTMLADLPLQMLDERIELIRKTLTECGRSKDQFRINDFVGWHVKEDRDAVFKEARRELVIRAWLMPDWLRPFLDEDEVALVQKNKMAFVKAYNDRSGKIDGVPERIVNILIDALTFTSTLAEIDKPLERLHKFKAAGVDEMSLRLHDDPAESIRIIGEHVVPVFR